MGNLLDYFRTVTLDSYIYLSTILFTIGVVGVLIRRNAIVIFMSIEIMLNSVNLLLVAVSAYAQDTAGQVGAIDIYYWDQAWVGRF